MIDAHEPRPSTPSMNVLLSAENRVGELEPHAAHSVVVTSGTPATIEVHRYSIQLALGGAALGLLGGVVSRGRSEYVLHLRCILLNGQWDEFAAHLACRGSLKLAAMPAPPTAHDAAKRAA